MTDQSARDDALAYLIFVLRRYYGDGEAELDMYRVAHLLATGKWPDEELDDAG